VTPPAFLLVRHQAAESDSHRPHCCSTASPEATVTDSGVRSRSVPACCQSAAKAEKQSSDAIATCCGSPAERSGSESAKSESDLHSVDEKRSCKSDSSEPGTSIVFWSSLQQCHGIDLAYTLFAFGWLPDSSAVVAGIDPILISVLVIENSVAESLCFAPEPPIP
tara:strand:- start:90913 stop:91407 length:495 start_codon:yes stop_codon:yes gene_type:complete